ncbi:hypothetical protein [Microbacterium sp. NPDC091662]|uniref:hypothetical protein n=1 Tax=Microbacterium sp. NPDC091662 TaxID=3364211 RepID=UPI0037F328AF
MFALPCITVLSNKGGCYVLGEHLSNCLGIRREGSRAVPCTGCLPQPATRGLLCESCWARHEASLEAAEDLITHVRSIERAPVPDGPHVHTAPGPRMIVPTSWLTADALWADLRELAYRLDPLELLEVRPGGTTAYGFGSRDSIEHVRDRVELAVDIIRAHGLGVARSDVTALLAVRFFRAAQRAIDMYPLEEQAQPLAYAKCRDCGNRTLERRPPLEHKEPITVRCIFPGCGAVFHPALVEYDLATYRETLEAETASDTKE